MDASRLAQSSDQLQQLEDAINTAEVSGWDVLAAVVIVVIAYPVGKAVAKATTGAVGRIPNLPDDLVKDVGRLAKWFTYLIAVAWALSLLGVNVGWVAIVVAVVVVFGFLMARPMVENIAAGTLLTVRPSFGVGDQVEAAGYRGTVEEIGSRSTVLRTGDGLRIHVANTDVLNAPIVVYTAYDSRKAAFNVSVTHDTDLDKATRLLIKVISGVDGVQQDPAPEVHATGLASTAITLSISYWYPSSMTSDSSVTDGVIRAVKSALSEVGIELAVPLLDVEPAAPSAASHTSEVDPATDDSAATLDGAQDGS
jgi:small-conductance mechanosensitive channel